MSISIDARIRLGWKTYERGFEDGLDSYQTIWQEIAEEDTLTVGASKQIEMDFSEEEMREWTGERLSTPLYTKIHTAFVKEYELFAKIPFAAFKDDTYGDSRFIKKFQRIGAAAKRHPQNQVINALKNGQTLACVDDQFFFSTTHPMNFFANGGPVWSNYYAAGTDLNRDNYMNVYMEMMLRKTWMGLPFRCMPSILLIPPQLKFIAEEILGDATYPVDGVAVRNKLQNTTRYIVCQDLMDQPTTWYLLSTENMRKPVHVLSKEKPTLQQVTNTSNLQFHIREIEYVADARDGVYFDWPHLATKCVGD